MRLQDNRNIQVRDMDPFHKNYPFRKGYEAFCNGQPRTDNLYWGQDKLDWDAGYEDARREERETEGFEDGDDGQPTEHDEWMDYDPDC